MTIIAGGQRVPTSSPRISAEQKRKQAEAEALADLQQVRITPMELIKHFGISYREVQYWDRKGYLKSDRPPRIGPTGKTIPYRRYSARQLVQFQLHHRLRTCRFKFSTQKIFTKPPPPKKRRRPGIIERIEARLKGRKGPIREYTAYLCRRKGRVDILVAREARFEPIEQKRWVAIPFAEIIDKILAFARSRKERPTNGD